MTTYEKAIEFALHLHADQFRQHTLEPFIVHPLRVANRLPWGYLDMRVVGVLHDAIDAGRARLEEDVLRGRGKSIKLTFHQARLLMAVTRRTGEADFSFFHRVMDSPGAREIVIADCEENLADLPTPHPERAAYEAALKVLRGQAQ